MRQPRKEDFLIDGVSIHWLMDLPQRLRWLRKNARPKPLRQTELAKMLGVTQGTISQAEIGLRLRMSPDEISEWAEACGYFAALAFVSTEEMADDGPALLSAADPDTLALVLNLLRAIENMSDETREAVHRILLSFTD